MKESFRFRGWKKAVVKLYQGKGKTCALTSEKLHELWKLAYQPAEVYREYPRG